MKQLLSALALFGLVAPAQAQTPMPISGWVMFNVPAQSCTGAIQQQTWTATSLLHLIAIQIWNGLDDGSAADVVENVARKSDGAMVINGNHDDYVNGGPVRIQKQSWSGNYFQINAGDSLIFSWMCNGAPQGAWNVTVWGY
jgi:hypothetical protein